MNAVAVVVGEEKFFREDFADVCGVGVVESCFALLGIRAAENKSVLRARDTDTRRDFFCKLKNPRVGSDVACLRQDKHFIFAETVSLNARA